MKCIQHRIEMGNGAAVVLHVFEPHDDAVRAGIIVTSAMGVAQRFYEKFAQWLASQGYRAVTFDYRGIGLSAPASLRGYRMNILDWAEDCAAVIDFTRDREPGAPLYWVGHSLGGQLLGLIRNRARIDRVMTVATGNGYWLEHAWRTRFMVWWLWFVVVPVVTRVAGYFPGKRLRMIGDLPRGVIEQWRRWCLNREYVVGVEGNAVRHDYAAITMPILAVSFIDDELMSERSIHSMHDLYRSAPVEYRRIAPRDIGASRIGHFGFFRSQFAPTLWPLVLQWLAQPARR